VVSSKTEINDAATAFGDLMRQVAEQQVVVAKAKEVLSDLQRQQVSAFQRLDAAAKQA